MTNSQFPNMLSPLKIGKTSVRNRTLVSVHALGITENNSHSWQVSPG